MTTMVEDRTQARIDGLLEMLRDAETDFRRSYARVLEVVAELEEQRAGAVSGFGTTARLLAGVLNLSKSEAKARAEQAGLLTPRQSLTGEVLPPALPATAAELAAGAIGPTHLRVITAPKLLRYRLLHLPARMTRGQRKRWLHLRADWPWTDDVINSWRVVKALPAPT